VAFARKREKRSSISGRAVGEEKSPPDILVRGKKGMEKHGRKKGGVGRSKSRKKKRGEIFLIACIEGEDLHVEKHQRG